MASPNQYEISKSEEDSLLQLMAECEFASASAEQFMEKLRAQLLHLDTSSIESIMNSEENTLRLIEMLDDAVADVEGVDRRLASYEEKISAVGDAVRIVGERDNVIQLQQNNQHGLLELLETMMGEYTGKKDTSKCIFKRMRYQEMQGIGEKKIPYIDRVGGRV